MIYIVPLLVTCCICVCFSNNIVFCQVSMLHQHLFLRLFFKVQGSFHALPHYKPVNTIKILLSFFIMYFSYHYWLYEEETGDLCPKVFSSIVLLFETYPLCLSWSFILHTRCTAVCSSVKANTSDESDLYLLAQSHQH